MEEDFYDTVWENSDGTKVTTFELHKDGTCDVKNFDWDICYSHNTFEFFGVDDSEVPESFRGYWAYDYDSHGDPIICIAAKDLRPGFILDVAFTILSKYRLRYVVDLDLGEDFDLERTDLNSEEKREKEKLDWRLYYGLY